MQMTKQILAFFFCFIRELNLYPRLPPAGVLHSQNKVIKCAAYGVAFVIGRGGFAKVDNRFGYEKWT